MWENKNLVANQFVINVQLKYLTNLFCFRISRHKSNFKNMFWCSHINISIEDELKSIKPLKQNII
jgi:hypothetical protein